MTISRTTGVVFLLVVLAVAGAGCRCSGRELFAKDTLKRRVTEARELIAETKAATVCYLSDNGKLPATQEAWVEALTGGDDPLIENGVDSLNDPWGNQLQYKRLKNKFTITSWGPDGEEGTEDDLSSAKKDSY